MKDYVDMADDRGGVHINSGIPNHAFYLAAISIGGDALSVLGNVWYVTLTTKLSATADFKEFASQTVAVAGEQYGGGGSVQRAVAEAWAKVGVAVTRIVTRTHARGQRPRSLANWRPHLSR